MQDLARRLVLIYKMVIFFKIIPRDLYSSNVHAQLKAPLIEVNPLELKFNDFRLPFAFFGF